MSKRIDTDVLVLKQACKALDKSTSRQMLRANIEFLVDRYLKRPAKTLPEHLKRETAHE